MATDPTTVAGIYRDGKVELLETPENVNEAKVLVTFLPNGSKSLKDYGMSQEQAQNLRARLGAFVEDWDLPEMGAYDAL